MIRTISVLLLIQTVKFVRSDLGIFDCQVDGIATRFFQLDLIQNSAKLTEIKDGRRLRPELNTYFVIHGWQETAKKTINFQVAEAIARYKASNVVLMDYSKWSYKFYNCAKEIVEAAGKSLAKFIVNAIDSNSTSLRRVHLNGMSLGGHVAGLAGRIIAKVYGRKIHRITGLDPAGPLFEHPFKLLSYLRLRKTDAVVVDILHTSALFGTIAPLGTVDFYSISDVGTMQPACTDSLQLGCSHLFSRNYFIESVNSCGIKGESPFDEDNIATYGFHMPENTTGMYIFYPNRYSPYGKYSPSCI